MPKKSYKNKKKSPKPPHKEYSNTTCPEFKDPFDQFQQAYTYSYTTPIPQNRDNFQDNHHQPNPKSRISKITCQNPPKQMTIASSIILSNHNLLATSSSSNMQPGSSENQSNSTHERSNVNNNQHCPVKQTRSLPESQNHLQYNLKSSISSDNSKSNKTNSHIPKSNSNYTNFESIHHSRYDIANLQQSPNKDVRSSLSDSYGKINLLNLNKDHMTNPSLSRHSFSDSVAAQSAKNSNVNLRSSMRSSKHPTTTPSNVQMIDRNPSSQGHVNQNFNSISYTTSSPTNSTNFQDKSPTSFHQDVMTQQPIKINTKQTYFESLGHDFQVEQHYDHHHQQQYQSPKEKVFNLSYCYDCCCNNCCTFQNKTLKKVLSISFIVVLYLRAI